MSGRAVTEAYEERLWDELNLLLADEVPADASPSEAEDAIVQTLRVPLTDTNDLYERIKRLAWSERLPLRTHGRGQPDHRCHLAHDGTAGLTGVVVADWSSAASVKPAPGFLGVGP